MSIAARLLTDGYYRKMEKKAFAERFRKAVAQAGVEDTQEALGRLLGVSSVMIWSYKTGEKMPRMSTAVRMAEKLKVNVSWLLSGTGRMSPDAESNIEPAPALRGRVPLISWVAAGDWCEAHDPYQPGDAEMWLQVSANYGARTYGLRVRGESMLPRFQEGEIIIIDPDAQVESGQYVIARKDGSKEVTFKQLIREGETAYLKPLNPQWPEPIIRIDGDWHICGKVVCKMELF